MVRCVFSDFDQFADAISGLDGRYIPTARSNQTWWIDPMRIGRLRLQQLQVGSPSTFAGDGEAPGVITVGIPTTDPGAIRIDGEEMTRESFILIRHNQPLTYSSHTFARWAGVTLPLQFGEEAPFRDAADWSAMTQSPTLLQTDHSALRRVSLLVAMLCSADDNIHLEEPAALAAAEEEVLIATSALLKSSSHATVSAAGRPRVARDRVIARCLEYCHEHVGRPVLVADLCRVTGVSERTLRNIFYEYFGVGPVRFLKVRQLQEVRAMLVKSAPGETVSSIAARVGVWDFNLFARNYREIYGEKPSETLRSWRTGYRRTATSDVDSIRSWMHFAGRRFVDVDVQSPALG